MPVNTRQITRDDIMDLGEYAKVRMKKRRALIPTKKLRRIEVGPYATFYFESYETMLAQVQEMLYIEKGGEEQVEDELNAYNPLIPQGKDLSATLMFEIDDPIRRLNILLRLGGVEEKCFIQVGDEKIYADPEQDVERTSEDGKTSAVHFLHFRLNDDQIASFKAADKQIMLGFDHENYAHLTILSPASLAELAKDFA